MKTLDCMGLSCPTPVMKTMELLNTSPENEVEVLVDNEAATQNVSRFLQSRGFNANVESVEGGFSVIGRRSGDYEACEIMSDEQLDSIDTENYDYDRHQQAWFRR